MLDAFLNKKTSLEVISGNVGFTWDEILRATGWFATDLIVGEGGSSTIYRGKLDKGEDVAVKRAKKFNLIIMNARVYKLIISLLSLSLSLFYFHLNTVLGLI